MRALRSLAAAAVLAFSLPATAATFTVTSGSDDGPGTLRQAILDANATPGHDRIVFAVDDVTFSPVTPVITDPVDIDGARAGGGRVRISPFFIADASGIQFGAGSNGSLLTHVWIDGPYTNAVHIDASAGGITIADNTIRGWLIANGPNATIERNQFPAPATGRIAIRGNNALVSQNTIAGRIEVSNASGAIIEGNTLTGTPFIAGVTVHHFPLPMGATVVRGNTISGHAIGVLVTATTANVSITGNSIFDTGIPIDLTGDGPTANDPAPDADLGANNLQNYPVLSSAGLHPSSLIVSGTLTSAPLTTYAIELFSDVAADPEARTPLGTFEVTTDAAGVAAFTHTVTSPLPAPGQVITSTATNRTTGDTSEVSAAVVIESHIPDHAIPTASTWGLLALAAALAAITLARITR